MAKVIKRRPLPPSRPAAAPSADPAPTAPGASPAGDHSGVPVSAVMAGAEEVRDKLRADLSRWLRVRRFASIKPTIGCFACDATGRVECLTCSGAGRVRMGPEAQVQACPTCEGSGSVSCVDCAGTGHVPNVRRKLILGLLGVGALAWLAVLWVWLGRDLLPEEKAAILHTGGGASQGPVHGGRVAPGLRNRTPGPTMGAPGTPANGGASAPGVGAVPGGVPVPGGGPAPQAGSQWQGGYAAPAAGGAYGSGGAPADTSHGGSWHPPGR